MMNSLFYKSYPEPEFDVKEILRYAGCRETSAEVSALLSECISECAGKLCYKVCYAEYQINIDGDAIDLGFTKVQSKDLAKNLGGC